MTNPGRLRKSLYSPALGVWYHYVSRADRAGEVIFMNYGYASEEHVDLQPADEVNRFGIQLYHRTVKGVDLAGRHILEVGCGRGGGASYIRRRFNPARYVGMDRSGKGIAFNNRRYRDDVLTFVAGDAHDLPFPADSFDVVLNVESSHLYLNFDRFLQEVKRVLRPGGCFLLSDFRRENEMEPMFRALERSGMHMVDKEDITDHIIRALDLDVERRMALVNKIVPRFLRQWARHYSGIKGSPFHSSFKQGRRRYFALKLRNPGDEG